jgi:hypothetical protein
MTDSPAFITRQPLKNLKIRIQRAQMQHRPVYIFDLRANFSKFAFLFWILFNFCGFGSHTWS